MNPWCRVGSNLSYKGRFPSGIERSVKSNEVERNKVSHNSKKNKEKKLK
jgi:hypothetical protein